MARHTYTRRQGTTVVYRLVPATGYHKRSESTTTDQPASVVLHPVSNVTTQHRRRKQQNIVKINIWVLFYAVISRQEVNAAKLV